MIERIFPLVLLALALLVPLGSAQAQTPFTPNQDAQATEADGGAAALEGLLDVLRDEEQRNALIEQLEAIEAGEAPGADAAASDIPPSEPPSFARQVAELTQRAVEGMYSTIGRLWRDLSGISSLASGLSEQRQQRILTNGPPLAATIVATLMLFWALTSLISRIARNQAPPGRGAWITVITVVINAFADSLSVALAYTVGYALAITVFGGGTLAVEQTLFLNAFLVAGLARIAIRIFVLPDRPEQAIFNFSGAVQSFIYRRVKTLSYLLAFGVSAAVPIANLWFSFLVGRSLRATIVTLAALLAVWTIHRVAKMIQEERLEVERKRLAERQPDENADAGEIAAAASEATAQASLSAWHKVWPWLAYLYVAFAYFIAITRPSLMADLVGLATLKTVIAGGILVLAFRFKNRASTAGAPVPRALQSALPELKVRLDAFVPSVLRLFSVGLVIVALGFIVDAWQIVDVGSWVASPTGSDIIWRLASAFMIVALIVLVWATLTSWIDNRLSLDLEGRNVSARSRTLLALFRNAFTVALFIFGTMTALSQLGIDIAPLLAGAGVIGLAIGFGSQKLVQDIITGIFIQLDNAINEGDVITVGGITGGVEKLTIRSVGIRDINGTYHIVPFSSVDTVSNFMRKFAFHVAEIGVAYKENIPAVKQAMHDAFDRLKAGEFGKQVIGDFEMHGVTALADSSVNVRARIRTKPGQQWGVGREYTQLVKEIFDERDIEIPFPHRQMVYPPPPALPGPKTEEPKTEEPKTEEPKTEQPQTEEPNTQEPKGRAPEKATPTRRRRRSKRQDEQKDEQQDLPNELEEH